jgi:DNA-binding NarL/FixJ family response regulator
LVSSELLLVDDHDLFAEAVSSLLNSYPFVSGVTRASTVREGKAALDALVPDIALVDLVLPDGSGMEIFDYLSERQENCSVIFMSGHFSPAQVAHLSQLEPGGMFSKSDGAEELQSAIQCIQNGDRFYSSEVTKLLSSADIGYSFSPRQLETLRLVQSGLTNKAIADQLGVSDSTVAFHLREVRSRLGLKTTREAIKAVQELGLI